MFDDVRFPINIGLDATGGPVHQTMVQTLASGAEKRIASWSLPISRYDVSSGVKNPTGFAEVLAFFRARQGRLRGFRFRDWSDYTSPRQTIGTTDGGLAAFQIIKAYTSGSSTRQRPITRPVAGTVHCWVDGTARTIGAGGTQFLVNTTTGVITIGATLASTTGQSVEVACEFDVPARFDTDQIAIELQLADVGEWPAIPLVEIRE